ncbi:MAG TPA: DUF397 domain-containing protein [Actinospica sp.]|nr:DUF397 domain-containing protein [Actinospica sp.]
MDTTRDQDLHWRTSSGCSNTTTCVEIAALPDGGVAIRDGKDPEGPRLLFDTAEWAEFLKAAKAGEFDPSSADAERPD